MNKTKNLPTAQGMLLMSLEPFFVSSSYNAVSITCAFHSCLSALSCPATIVLVMQCCCPSPSPSLSSSCGGPSHHPLLSCGCPHHHIPCHWSLSSGPCCCGYCCCPIIGVGVVLSHCFSHCGPPSFLLLCSPCLCHASCFHSANSCSQGWGAGGHHHLCLTIPCLCPIAPVIGRHPVLLLS